MCCFESIVNAVIQKIIKEMHQTAEPEQREWARENILDAVVLPDVKVVSLAVTSEEVKQQIQRNEITGLLTGLMLAYPGHTYEVTVKQPLDLTVFSLDKVAH